MILTPKTKAECASRIAVLNREIASYQQRIAECQRSIETHRRNAGPTTRATANSNISMIRSTIAEYRGGIARCKSEISSLRAQMQALKE